MRGLLRYVYRDGVALRLGLLLSLFVGCTNNNPSQSQDAGVSVDQACADYVAAYCGKLSQCAGPLFIPLFGDVATCSSRLQVVCPATFAAPGTSATSAQMEVCAQAMNAASCDVLYQRESVPACEAMPGMVIDGMACGDDAQCMSTYC